MKIERFLTWIQKKLLFYPDINLPTIKMFIDKFESCLSKNEKERWNVQVQLIKEFSLKQISLDGFVLDSKIDSLTNELNRIKEVDKK